MSTTTRLIKPARRAVAHALRGPAPLPEVQNERAEAVAFFQGWWQGIAIGFVSGAALVVVALGSLGMLP